MHDLHCADAEKMYNSIFADRVRELKHTQKGVERMCREVEQIYRNAMGILLFYSIYFDFPFPG